MSSLPTPELQHAETSKRLPKRFQRCRWQPHAYSALAAHLTGFLIEMRLSCAAAGWLQNVFEHNGLCHQMELGQHRVQPGMTSWHYPCSTCSKAVPRLEVTKAAILTGGQRSMFCHAGFRRQLTYRFRGAARRLSAALILPATVWSHPRRFRDGEPQTLDLALTPISDCCPSSCLCSIHYIMICFMSAGEHQCFLFV